MSNIEYKPAEKLELHLSRPDSRVPWGFRLQGGIDFSTPLSIQSVNPNSVSEQCGIKPGDAILAINNFTSDAMTHDDAKEEIMRSGNHIAMLVERGAVKIWKPQVTPLSELRPQELRTITSATGEDVTPVQKTSLALNKPPDAPCTIGSSHNRSAQPFGKPKAAVPNVVHSQYNSPMGLYSANNIADSFAKQTEGIQTQMQNMDVNDAPVGTVISGAGQVLEQEVPVAEPPGIEVTPTQSSGMHLTTPTTSSAPQAQTYRPVSPSGFRPVSPSGFRPVSPSGFRPVSPSGFRPVSPSIPSTHSQQQQTPYSAGSDDDSPAPIMQSRTFQKVQQELEAQGEPESNNNNNNVNIRGFKSVSAPIAKPPSERPQQPSMRCGGCDMLATGVIVKASGVPYHVACFKCASCSMNLKQKGFFLVEGNLYCETHAKRHAKPPGSDMVAVASYR